MLNGLTIVIFTLGRREYLLDLIRYWAEIESNAEFMILDGSSNPVKFEDIADIFPDKTRIKIFASRSLWDRFDLCADNLTTKYCIWHADDDFLLPNALNDALERLKARKGSCIFSNVRGFTDQHLQFEHPLIEWRDYELTNVTPRERALKFASNRANRFYYAIWPSSKFAVALKANSIASRAIEEEKLIFGDVGMELAGALLCRLEISESNFLLKRDELVSQPSVTDMPTLSEYALQDGGKKFAIWIEKFAYEMSKSMMESATELQYIVEAFFAELIKRERNMSSEESKKISRRLKTLYLEVKKVDCKALELLL